MEEQVWNLALLAGPREQLEAAQYFESSDKPEPDKAVLLYHRAGMLHKALDLAFKYVVYRRFQISPPCCRNKFLSSLNCLCCFYNGSHWLYHSLK